MSTIVIDPGHGGWDNGASNNGRLEKNDNLRIGQAVAQRLRNLGYTVVMTRNSDVYVPLLDRSYISNNAGADLFVSLHRNSFTSPAANGVETYVQTGAPATTRQYATYVQNEIVNTGVQSNRGVKDGNYSVLRYTQAPAMLVELGFISNATDNLMFDQYFDAYADAIVRGIQKSVPLANTGSGGGTAAGGNATTRAIQTTLNSRYGTGLTVDGYYGPRTKTALIKGLQTELNRSYGTGLTADGIWGPRTKAAVRVQRRGNNNNLVYLLQAALFFGGYSIGVDGAFGPATENAVRSLQSIAGLSVDGLAGANTYEAAFKRI